jgi:hypothetical protein
MAFGSRFIGFWTILKIKILHKWSRNAGLFMKYFCLQNHILIQLHLIKYELNFNINNLFTDPQVHILVHLPIIYFLQ